MKKGVWKNGTRRQINKNELEEYEKIKRACRHSDSEITRMKEDVYLFMY